MSTVFILSNRVIKQQSINLIYDEVSQQLFDQYEAKQIAGFEISVLSSFEEYFDFNFLSWYYCPKVHDFPLIGMIVSNDKGDFYDSLQMKGFSMFKNEKRQLMHLNDHCLEIMKRGIECEILKKKEIDQTSVAVPPFYVKLDKMVDELTKILEHQHKEKFIHLLRGKNWNFAKVSVKTELKTLKELEEMFS
jgi:hypothetical protein